MRYLSLAVLSSVLFTLVAQADDSISPDVVAAAKAATVFVKIKANGMEGSGSGFVVKTEGDTAYIVTNDHVAEPKDVEVVVVPRVGQVRPRRTPGGAPLPSRPLPGRPADSEPEPRYSVQIVTRTFKNVEVTAVFQSGTKQEESFRGELLAVDPGKDLAVLKVSGLKTLPKSIDIRPPKLSETMPIYVFGFPLGSDLSVGKNNPAITVGKGSVSSLRLDDDGELSVVQVDAALNHGNSGGPVVDSKGRLVGVAEARVTEDESTNIGMAVPAQEVAKMLSGRIGKVALHVTKEADGSATVHVQVGLIDPMSKVKAVALDYVAAKAAPDALKPTDPLFPLSSSHRLKLKIDKQVATGEFTLKQGLTEIALIYQPVCVNGSGVKEIAKNVKQTLRIGAPVVATAPPAAGNPGVASTPNGSNRTAPMPAASREVAVGVQIGRPVRLSLPGKGLLIGLEVGVDKIFGTSDVVSSVRPIFSNEKGEEVSGQQVVGTAPGNPVVLKAKPGYAIGAITGKTGARLDGLSVTFMKIDKDRLNTNDKYESDWVGGKGGGPETRLGGDGTPVAGILGWQGRWQGGSAVCAAVGLIMAGANPAPSMTVIGSGELPTPTRDVALGAQMGTPVRLAAPGKGQLIGLEVGLGKWSTNDIVSSFRPVFSDEKGGEVKGEKAVGAPSGNPVVIKAKPGYAIGAITAKAMIRVDGFSVTFMKIDKDRLNPNDKYESDWIGGKGGGPERRLGGDGTPIVGIVGWESGSECTAVGLIMGGASPAAAGAVVGQGTSPQPASPANELTEFTSKNGMFTIKFPVGERLIRQARLVPIHNRGVVAEGMKKILNGGATSVTAVSLTLPAAVMSEVPAEKRFDEIRDGIVKQLFAKATEETDITLDLLSGKRYEVETRTGVARLEVCLINDAVWYTLVEGKTKEALTSADVDAFNSSFHLTAEGKAAAEKAAKGK